MSGMNLTRSAHKSLRSLPGRAIACVSWSGCFALICIAAAPSSVTIGPQA